MCSAGILSTLLTSPSLALDSLPMVKEVDSTRVKLAIPTIRKNHLPTSTRGAVRLLGELLVRILDYFT